MVWEFTGWRFATGVAWRHARRTGSRMRVTKHPTTGMWLVYPTPAEAPTSVVIEPCS